ncbi:MAG TPA: NosD domain-containing protein [Methanothrix sp.]|nr:NosD domain-containing protein [Methanothrix sp.]
MQSGSDVQAAINAAMAGDTVVLGPGEHSPFEVDKPLTILGRGGPIIKAAIQKPGMKISCDGVMVSGLKIDGVAEDTAANFNYYMENPAAAAGQRLDQPNAAIIVNGNSIALQNCTIFGAQVGIWAENADNLILRNVTLDSCDEGASLARCQDLRIEECLVTNCKKSGLDLEEGRNFVVQDSRIVGTGSTGLLLKHTQNCSIMGNIFSGNTFGLALWNSSLNQVRGNQADHNYYGILVTDSSDNNTIAENVAVDNTRNEFVKGFGEGISLQENSSHNLVVRNTAKGNFNGVELSKGCKFNAVYDNDVTDNSHGIRLNENRNNVIFGNNFLRNQINAYENASLNIWNTTIGNCYSDYEGQDENGDGIGDQPYAIAGQDSKSFDYRPLTRQYSNASWNDAAIREAVKVYAKFGPADYEIPVLRMEKGTIAISYRRPSSPPKWADSKPLDVNTGYTG